EPGWVVATVVLCRPAVLESQSNVPWKIVRLQEIAPPHFVRLERQLAGDPIDQALHDEARVGPTSASVRTDARRVGVDHGELGAIVRHLVGAWSLRPGNDPHHEAVARVRAGGGDARA